MLFVPYGPKIVLGHVVSTYVNFDNLIYCMWVLREINEIIPSKVTTGTNRNQPANLANQPANPSVLKLSNNSIQYNNNNSTIE